MSADLPLSERVAIVTGAGAGQGGKGGIGRGIALRLASEGARVVVTDFDDGAAETADIIINQGGSASFHQGDLSTEQGATDLLDHTVSTWGRVDILVNNAGGGGIRPFLDHNAESIEQVISRNLMTMIWCCHKALPHMLKQNYGRIINMGADSVRNGLDFHTAYNAAKGGVHAIVSGLAREYADYDITANVVAPPIVETAFVKDMLKSVPDGDDYQVIPDKEMDRFFNMIPKKRGAEVEEVAAFVAFLAREESGFITGQVLSINGGSTMQ